MGLTPQTNRFLREEEIIKFFCTIYENTEWDVLILITRKGYWSYKVLVDMETQENIKKSGRKVYSDRYITKCLDFDQFKGKRVWIYDDTMTHGSTLFFYYCYFRKIGVSVTPIVYGLSTDYPSDETKRYLKREYQRVIRNLEDSMSEEEKLRRAEENIEAFDKELRWHVRLSAANIAALCKKETQMFQNYLSPLVIDLPILSSMKIDEIKSSLPAYMDHGSGQGVHMNLDDFHKLKSSFDKWEYVENQFVYQDIDVQCGYFRMRDEILLEKNLSFLHDLIVKCKYCESDDSVKCVFVPFAIFRSLSFQDTIRCFFSLLNSKDYGEDIYSFISKKWGITIAQLCECDIEELAHNDFLINLMKNNHNLCKYMFRSIIFYISELVGCCFVEHVYEVTGITLKYDFDIMEESFSTKFIERFKEHRLASNEYRTNLLQLPDLKSIAPVNQYESGNDLKILAENNKDKIEQYILFRLLQKKNIDSEDIKSRIFTIETLEAELDAFCIFDNEDERRQCITKLMISMLDTSRFGNEIYVDNQEQVIYRGFRYGENSELMFLKGMDYFYAFVLAFYCSLGIGKSKEEKAKSFKEHYSRFINNLELHFREQEYFGTLISRDVFNFLKEYFKNISESKLETQIFNKMFVLNDYWDRETYHGIRSFVDQAFVLVHYWI